MASPSFVAAKSRKCGLWILVALGLLLCGSTIAPLGGLDAWLHSHGTSGWHLHVDQGDPHDGHGRALAAHVHHEHARSEVVDAAHRDGRECAHEHECAGHGHVEDAARLDLARSHHGTCVEARSDGGCAAYHETSCGVSIQLPELLIASGRAHDSTTAAGSSASCPCARDREPCSSALLAGAFSSRLSDRGPPPRTRHRSGIALVLLRTHAILV